ncbi:MAG TPA: hypothetical protein VJP87_02885 [Candidatus Acidoferrales bacterium]|nr:hypothetical protein [Candidatus Acidoferrales bacterium]
MKAATRAAALAALMILASVGGCRKAQSETDAIRAGVMQHLTSLNTLNLSAMDMDVNSVTVQGNEAHAQVTFRPKSGAPQGAGMQVSYQLEKRDSRWVVVKTDGIGGVIQHPSSSANPHQQTGQMDGKNVPDLHDLISPQTPSSGGTALPPGHPPVASKDGASQQPPSRE